MPPRGRYTSSKKSTSKKGKGPSRGQQRSQSKRDSQRRQQQQQSQNEQRQEQQQREQQREQQQREQRANVREQARQPTPTKKTQPVKTTQPIKTTQEDKRGIMSTIGHGPIQEDYIGDEAFKKTQPAGQHKLRSQFERLASKYGPGFANTSQGQQLMDYLSGVAVERGGGLGAKDPTYGGGEFTLDPESDEFKDAEAYRQQLLSRLESSLAAGGRPSYEGINDALARKGLSPDQYFKFRQQLMAADPTPGNMAYKEAFPFASGQLAQGIAGLMPGMGPFKAFAKTALSPFAEAGKDLRTMVEPITSAVKPTLTGLRTNIGDMFGRPFKGLGQGIGNLFNPPAEAYGNIGRPFAAAPSVRPGGGGGGAGIPSAYAGPITPTNLTDVTFQPGGEGPAGWDPTQGVIGGMPGMYQPGYGGSIGRENEVRTADFQDRDRDQIDDRDQAGPGQPHWRGSMGQGQKFVGDLPRGDMPTRNITQLPGPRGNIPMAPSALTPGSALAMSPMTHQLQFQQPNVSWQQWNQNVVRFS